MAIASSHELGRTLEAEIGTPAKAIRRWALVLSDNTLSGNPAHALNEYDVLSSLGLGLWGMPHPTFAHLGLRRLVITERLGDSPYHAEAVAEYGYASENEYLAPTSRRADWKTESQPGEVPAFFYYHGDSEGVGNADKRPLTNSAFDFFEGLIASESMVRITITKNFWPFPSAMVGLHNHINSDPYFNCPAWTIKCDGVQTDYTQEFFANTTYQFFATTITLLYRQSGWPLLIPDVGWNFLNGTQKQRGMVFDFKNSEWVASPNPIPLDGNGGIASGQPSILKRRVNPEANFLALLGKPPTDTTWPIGSL